MEFAEINDLREARLILADRLRQALDQNSHHGITSVQRLAEATGISTSYVASILRAEKTPSLGYVFLLSEALGIYVPELIVGLERFIKPKNYIVKDRTDQEKARYELAIQYEWERFISNTARSKNVSYDEKDLGVNRPEELMIYDNSMEALGIKKGSTVIYSFLRDEPIIGNIYIARSKGKLVLRRLWSHGDYYILIPCSNDLSYEVDVVHREDSEIIGIPIGYYTKIDQVPPQRE